MIEPWGRSPAAGTWPHPTPVWTLAALLLALASGALVAVYRYHAVWTPLQRAYAPTHLRCVVMAAVGVTTTGRYRLLEVEIALGEQHDTETAENLYNFDIPLRQARERFEKAYLEHQLKQHQGSVSKIAKIVGMERTHLYRKLKSLNIDIKS